MIGGRIVLVDDEKELVAVLAELLAGYGYKVFGFTSAPEALEYIKQENVDLLITDLMMPGMDGITLMKKAFDANPDILGIVMTGQGTVNTAVEAMKIGALDYILKPFKINSLVPVITRAMEVSRLRKENLLLRETISLLELSKSMSFGLSLKAILQKLCDALQEQCSAEELSIMLHMENENELYVALVRGKGREKLLGQKVALEQGIAGWVAHNQEPIRLEGEVCDPRFTPVNPRKDIKTAVSMPMIAGGKVVGVINVNFLNKDNITLGKIKVLEFFASAAAIIVERFFTAAKNEKLIEQNEEIIAVNTGLTDQNEEITAMNEEITLLNEKLKTMNDELELRIQERTADLIATQQKLTAQYEELRQAEEDLRKLNATLEQRIIERTLQWEVANKELERFNHSVAHDLRAPLRHIIGFIKILGSELVDQLDEAKRGYLQRIQDAAMEMEKLIDHLLEFSRLGKAEMFQTRVNSNKLVQEALTILNTEIQGRNIEWIIGELPAATGDNSLLRVVWVNLLGNALKYTRPRQQARIEIGTAPDSQYSESVAFYIKDNGVGFDMKYKDKLFGLFQRMHSTGEFEGNGVGLANVQRIIVRHGGRVWGEAAVNEGATFYFTLHKYQ